MGFRLISRGVFRKCDYQYQDIHEWYLIERPGKIGRIKSEGVTVGRLCLWFGPGTISRLLPCERAMWLAFVEQPLIPCLHSVWRYSVCRITALRFAVWRLRDTWPERDLAVWIYGSIGKNSFKQKAHLILIELREKLILNVILGGLLNFDSNETLL